MPRVLQVALSRYGRVKELLSSAENRDLEAVEIALRRELDLLNVFLYFMGFKHPVVEIDMPSFDGIVPR